MSQGISQKSARETEVMSTISWSATAAPTPPLPPVFCQAISHLFATDHVSPGSRRLRPAASRLLPRTKHANKIYEQRCLFAMIYSPNAYGYPQIHRLRRLTKLRITVALLPTMAAHLSSTANSFTSNHPRCGEASSVTRNACQKSCFSDFETVSQYGQTQ
jgi:hypothetical protein